MKFYKLAKGLAYISTVILFIWFILLKIVARIAARAGQSAPCPASLAKIVDNPLRRSYMRPVLGWTGIRPGEQVLELGPGPGAFTIAAARQAGPDGRIFAVDIQPQMIAQVQKRVQESGLSNVVTHVAGAYDLPISDHSIDRAFLISVLPEILDQSKALAELRRVLRSGGVLSITAEFADPDYLFARETLRLLEQNGFTLVEKHGSWWCYTMNFRPADGSPQGDFRFKHRRPTSWPPGLQEEDKRSLTAETVALLRHPETHDSLRYETDTSKDGRFQEWLVAEESGERFPIEDGIPNFIKPQDIVDLNKKYRTFYGLSAPMYDFFVRLYSHLWGGSEALWRQEFLRELEIENGDRVLEVSVGTGGNLRLLPETAEYYGLDLTKGMLRQCRRNLRRWQRSAALFNGNAERLPFDDAGFDVVFHVGGINFFNDQEAAIREMIRVAKPGTKILIVDETNEGIRQYEKMPGLSLLIGNERQKAKAPVELVPSEMVDINVTSISNGDFYCLTFRKPQGNTVVSVKRETFLTTC